MSNNKTATVPVTSRATGITRTLSVVWDPEGWEHCSTQRLSDWDDAPVWESDWQFFYEGDADPDDYEIVRPVYAPVADDSTTNKETP